MHKKRLNYQEGSCFLLPLRGGGFARGVVARMNGKGAVFGYFFGPKILDVAVADFEGLDPQSAVWRCDFGDLGLIRGEWIVFGKIPVWRREEWPMPPFIRVDEAANRAWLSFYDEKTFAFIREIEVDPSLVMQYPEDGTNGYGAVEIYLSKLLS